MYGPPSLSNGRGVTREEMLCQKEGSMQQARGNAPRVGEKKKGPNQECNDHLLGDESKTMILSKFCATGGLLRRLNQAERKALEAVPLIGALYHEP